MKKHLIAVAVAAAVAVPAVAQVSVSGTIDVSAQRTNKLTERAASATVQTQTNTTNTGGGSEALVASKDGWATSEFIFQATEDLGGGLKATARFSQAISTDSFVQRDKYIDVAGGFGSVRLGRFNPAIGGLNAYSGAGSTAPGGDLNQMTNGGVRIMGGTAATAGASFERNNGLIQFTTPSFSGFTVNALYGDNSTDITSTANRVTESKMQGFGAAYTAGPLKVEFASGQRKNKTAGVAGTAATAFFFNGTANNTATQVVPTTAAVGSQVAIGAVTTGNTSIAAQMTNFTFSTTAGTTPANLASSIAVGIISTAGLTAVEQLNATHDFDWLGASYNLGPATVMASHSRRQMQSNTTTTTARATLNDIKINSVGLMVPMGATTLRVSTYTGKDERTTGNADDVKLAGQQISATYSLSKRTYFYAAMGESDVKRDTAGGTAAERKEKTTGLGLVHSF